MVELCREGPVRLPYNNSTQFPESLAQHVGSGGDSITGMYTRGIQNMQYTIIDFLESPSYINIICQYNYFLLTQEVLSKLYICIQLFLSSLTFTTNGRRMTGNRAATIRPAVSKPLLLCSTLATSLASQSA